MHAWLFSWRLRFRSRELLASFLVNRGVVCRRRQQPRTRTGVGKGRVGPARRSVPPRSPCLKFGVDIAAVPTDDATERDIQRAAQWPVCRSRCQCHPPPPSLPLAVSRLFSFLSVRGFATPIPDPCLENPRDIRRTPPVLAAPI